MLKSALSAFGLGSGSKRSLSGNERGQLMSESMELSVSSEYPTKPADPQAVLRAVRKVLPKDRHPNPKLHAPSVGQWERGYALKAISNGLVGYEFIDKFQRELAEACGV